MTSDRYNAQLRAGAAAIKEGLRLRAEDAARASEVARAAPTNLSDDWRQQWERMALEAGWVASPTTSGHWVDLDDPAVRERLVAELYRWEYPSMALADAVLRALRGSDEEGAG